MTASDNIDPLLVRLFVGYGGDVTKRDGTVFKAEDQQKLKMNFLKIIRKKFGDGTLSDIMIWFHSSSETALGREVTISSLSLDLEIPMSTVSHSVTKMSGMRLLERFTKPDDRRRVYIRIPEDIIGSFRRHAEQHCEVWDSQRRLMSQMIENSEQEKNSKKNQPGYKKRSFG
ncbi:MAG: winged helix DNA-binding protein [Pseudomonadota bacterium]